jgi:hypothetical protein
MYVSRNIEALSCNHCCGGKAMSNTQPECVGVCSLSYPACNAHAPYFHLRPPPLCNIFSTISHTWYDFRKKVTEHKICINFIYGVCLKHFSFYEEVRYDKIYIGLHVKYPLFLSDFRKIEFSR